jgi:hypothetical protein
MGTVQHWGLVSIPVRSILTAITTRTPRIGAVHRRSGHEGSLRGDGVEQALLVEADTVLAPTVRRVLVA